MLDIAGPRATCSPARPSVGVGALRAKRLKDQRHSDQNVLTNLVSPQLKKPCSWLSAVEACKACVCVVVCRQYRRPFVESSFSVALRPKIAVGRFQGPSQHSSLLYGVLALASGHGPWPSWHSHQPMECCQIRSYAFCDRSASLPSAMAACHHSTHTCHANLFDQGRLSCYFYSPYPQTHPAKTTLFRWEWQRGFGLATTTI